VLIPAENEKDLADIPANVKEGLRIIPVAHADQVLEYALTTPLIPIDWVEPAELAVVPDAVVAEVALRH